MIKNKVGKNVHIYGFMQKAKEKTFWKRNIALGLILQLAVE